MTIEDEINLLKTGGLPVDMGNSNVSSTFDEQMAKLELEKYQLEKELEELKSILRELQKGGVLAKPRTKQKEEKKEESDKGSEEDDSSPASLMALFLVVGLVVGGVWAYKNGLLTTSSEQVLSSSSSSSFITGEANKAEAVINDSDLKETAKNRAIEKIKDSGLVSEAEIEKAKELKEAATPGFNWLKQKAKEEAEKRYEAYKEAKE